MVKIFIKFSLLFLFSNQLFANKEIHWSLAIAVPSTFTPLSSPSYKVAKFVRQLSNNKFIIKIEGKEKHQSSKSILELVQKNTFQIGHSISSNTYDLDINTIWFSGIPFGMTDIELQAWCKYGDGQKYMKTVYDKYGVIAFLGGSIGTQLFGWSNKEIQTVQDFTNFQINAKGIKAEVLSTYNAKIKNIPLSQNVDAFKEGRLDIINGISPSIDIKMGFHKVATYYYTSWDRPSSSMQFLVNKEAYQKLPDNFKIILKNAIELASYQINVENFSKASIAWKKIQFSYPNIKVLSLPNNVLQELSYTTQKILQQHAKENKLFKEIYENQLRFLNESRNWNKLTESTFIQNVNKFK